VNPNQSSFLHLVRWLSALFVIVGHSQQIGGWNNGVFVYVASHAHAAVIVFFVLSGYVIAESVERKRRFGYTIKEYYADRISRIYSVLIPALILTVILDLFGNFFFPDRYADPQLIPQDSYFIRLFINAASLQGIWGHRSQFGSNPALWSIGYEFFYYIVYGLIVWKPRYWLVLALTFSCVVGPYTILYGLIWLTGVFAFKLRKRLNVNFFVWLSLLFVANHYLQYAPNQIIQHLPQFYKDFTFGIFGSLMLISGLVTHHTHIIIQ
jgi:peptidoglycan/LPS O-acetylase OafA/YrhL